MDSNKLIRYADICLLSNEIHDYFYVSQGKTSIPGVDDGEEFQLTDVSKQIPSKYPPDVSSRCLSPYVKVEICVS